MKIFLIADILLAVLNTHFMAPDGSRIACAREKEDQQEAREKRKTNKKKIKTEEARLFYWPNSVLAIYDENFADEIVTLLFTSIMVY